MRALTTAVIAAAILTSGCISIGKDVGRKFDPEARRLIKLQQTSKSEVRRIFGEPFEVEIDPARRESWTYTYSNVRTTVPIFLPPIPGVFSDTKVQPIYTLMVTFGGDVVVDCLYLEMHGFAGDPTKPSKRITEKCGE